MKNTVIFLSVENLKFLLKDIDVDLEDDFI